MKLSLARDGITSLGYFEKAFLLTKYIANPEFRLHFTSIQTQPVSNCAENQQRKMRTIWPLKTVTKRLATRFEAL